MVGRNRKVKSKGSKRSKISHRSKRGGARRKNKKMMTKRRTKMKGAGHDWSALAEDWLRRLEPLMAVILAAIGVILGMKISGFLDYLKKSRREESHKVAEFILEKGEYTGIEWEKGRGGAIKMCHSRRLKHGEYGLAAVSKINDGSLAATKHEWIKPGMILKKVNGDTCSNNKKDQLDAIRRIREEGGRLELEFDTTCKAKLSNEPIHPDYLNWATADK